MLKSKTTSYMLLVFALLAILPTLNALVRTTEQYCNDNNAGGHTAINRLW